uniref:ASH domain-containing protein n=1 Tax=Mesocestoides corti TaxID=53468 RepID=A0A5K3EYW5_MESCO
EAAYNIVLEPQKFELQPLESVDFSLKVFSSRPQKITFNLKCFTVIDNHGHKRLIKECAVSAEFIQPMVEIIPNPVGFRILKVPDEILREVSQDILIKNTSEIPTTFLLTIDPPFFFRPHGSTTQQLV